ncbi:glycoside hydrolase family 57 protein [Solemya velum gill symbiont]|uniref:glycoside hydrolase family 57 protein n=1 Tax=Solemya velum gill symbiont TaxID=2340 RepID=UPI000996A17C|nr:glycoside hydrolase family 57 protein [Solemya velum gill symbiont]OOZ00885.1 glycoside hydrolase [Solemya velum gill symbiont]OOZ03069.1 glycoside hydrolase [Solemya velum gill symbiont]OOZ05319.1 glycoside hydrolase [Solemya velum gill symbiont]OOZ07555.1 glycoside hydrolase [Solemya velum gill symbiont]OOZ09759.1 glycoside hydrolase [Solemya velum gill symbiont]
MGAVKLNLVLCWHMHQPHYREGVDGEYSLPWVYLHGIKDYTDMAAHLENNPGMRSVVNFAPVLLEQIDDYAHQLKDYFDHGKATSDPFLNQLIGAVAIPQDANGRSELVGHCLRCNAPRMIEPYAVFHGLVRWFDHFEEFDVASDARAVEILNYLDEQYFIDLICWYHISWLGESVRSDERVVRLMEKERGFTDDDRRQLAEVIHDSLNGLIDRYRALADSGQVELSMTPYGHPIVPLLHDFENMRCALPDAPVPMAEGYPGGSERSRWHMDKGIELFQHYFGRRPQGVWLSEGGVSSDALKLLDEYQMRWTATGEGVWRNSCHLSKHDAEDINTKKGLFSPHSHNSDKVRVFFRDDGLSDLIGFEYSKWDTHDAVADFMQHLNNIADSIGDDADQRVVSVILDGENAWEYYYANGALFLDGLYKACASSDRIALRTFSEVADLEARALTELCPGSWVYGSFSTWIGEKDKNLAWDYLVAAKQVYDEAVASGKLSDEQKREATQQLAVCEASDWFWWFGDYNPSDSVRDFEQLFRLQLRRLYSLLQLTPPAVLEQPLSSGGGHGEHSGTMRRTV